MQLGPQALEHSFLTWGAWTMMTLEGVCSVVCISEERVHSFKEYTYKKKKEYTYKGGFVASQKFKSLHIRGSLPVPWRN